MEEYLDEQDRRALRLNTAMHRKVIPLPIKKEPEQPSFMARFKRWVERALCAMGGVR